MQLLPSAVTQSSYLVNTQSVSESEWESESLHKLSSVLKECVLPAGPVTSLKTHKSLCRLVQVPSAPPGTHKDLLWLTWCKKREEKSPLSWNKMLSGHFISLLRNLWWYPSRLFHCRGNFNSCSLLPPQNMSDLGGYFIPAWSPTPDPNHKTFL